jgi:hypothetical protein
LGLSPLVELAPVLSDQGRGLVAYCQGHESHHYFCYRHLLELLGSRTYVALLGRRLMFTGSESEYRELKAITIIDFQIGCQEGVINANGASHFCELFGLSLDRDNHVSEESVDPFITQALWSERGDRGVATCTNHSEGFHGRANRKVAGLRCLTRRIATVIDMLTKKHQQFSVAKLNRSANTKFLALTKSVKRARVESVSPSEGCPYHCGWDRIYANRFKIQHFPCRHTVLNPALNLDWDRHGIDLELGRQDSVHEIVVIPYTGSNWPLSSVRDRERGRLPIQESEGLSVIGDADKFIRRLHAEFSVVFPHTPLPTRIELGIELGRFDAQHNFPETEELHSRFQLQLFRQYSRG